MKISNLKNKLYKMKVEIAILDHNGYNKDLCFTINGIDYKAGIIEGNENIQDYCREICYYNSEQEMQRRFFTSFNELLKYSNLKK